MNIFLTYSKYDKIVLGFLLSINILAFLFYGLDKLKARRKSWRIPELNLILLGILGGGLGSLAAMVFFHHKLNKKKFFLGVPIISLLNFIGFLYLYQFFKGLV